MTCLKDTAQIGRQTMPRTIHAIPIAALALTAFTAPTLANRAWTPEERAHPGVTPESTPSDSSVLWTHPAPGALAMFGLSAGFAIRGRRRGHL